jgi:hypothetical protein
MNQIHARKNGLNKSHPAWYKGTKGICKAWNKGKKLSKEHCGNLNKSHKGQKAWNKGLIKDMQLLYNS